MWWRGCKGYKTFSVKSFDFLNEIRLCGMIFHFSDITKGHENIVIPAVNNVNNSDIPADFTYMKTRIVSPEISVDLMEFLSKCDCDDLCAELSTCNCLQYAERCWYDQVKNFQKKIFKIFSNFLILLGGGG